jgi:pilus assembly protein CpaE
MTLLVERDSTRADPLMAALGGDVLVMDSLEAARRFLADDLTEDVVVVGADVDLQAATAFTEGFRLARPSLSVVLVRRRVETSVLTEALHSGMRDVVEERDLTRLRLAIDRARRTSAAIRDQGVLQLTGESVSRGRVVTVFSAKGGTGKTTLSTNLAAALAAGGRRSVCLVDLDLGFGDVGITMQLFPARTMADVSGLGAAIDPESLQGLLTEHSPGLKVLVAPIAPDEKQKITPDVVGAVLEALAKEFAYVVVDTAPSLDDLAVAAFDRTDVLLLLATLDIPAVKNLKLSLEMLDLLDFPKEQRHVVMNRADAKVGLTVTETAKSLKTEVEAQIPSSRDVPATVNRGALLMIENPRHPVSVAIKSIAETIVVADGVAAGVSASPAHVTTEDAAATRGLFRRRRS